MKSIQRNKNQEKVQKFIHFILKNSIIFLSTPKKVSFVPASKSNEKNKNLKHQDKINQEIFCQRVFVKQ